MLSPEEWQVLALSARVALAATTLLLVPGVALGWLLARVRFPGKAVVEVAVYLPLVLPPVVTGWLLLQVLGRGGLDIAFSETAAVVAAAAMALPLLVRAVRLAIELVDRELEQAAACCGARGWRVLVEVTLPLAWPGIAAGAILAFARSLGEFGATIVVAGNIPGESRTLALAVYTALQRPGGDAAAWRLVVIAAIFAAGALLASELLARRAQRRLGVAG